MKWQFIKAEDGVFLRIEAEPNDTEEQIQEIRRLRHKQAQESGVVESLKDEVTLYSKLS